MSHKIQKQWCEGLKVAMPRFFEFKSILEMGSLNVNGSLRPLFENCDYVGVDVIAGKDVDVVGIFHEVDFRGVMFDVVCSVNSLEHDMHFDKTLPRMYDLLMPGGLLFISVAFKWAKHGTSKCSPLASGTAQLKGKWKDYYKNVTLEDMMRHFKYGMFRHHMLCVCHKDIQFVGIK